MEIKEMFNLTRVPTILILGVVYVIYVLIGGVIFWKLEGDLGQKDISLLLRSKNILLTTYPCLNQEGLEAVAQVVQDASKIGLSLKGNYTTDGFWKFTSSAVFAATVVTTIGYGNMSPSSDAGQIFCVFFALFGIPLNVVVLNRVGKYMLAIERNISDFLEKKTKRRRCTRFFVHLVSYLSGTVLFFIVPMIVFQMHEGWTYSQAIYYCFITLSTIGFGDFVAGTVQLFPPNKDSNPDKVYPEWYSILMASWIFFGLAWLALIINHSIDILERLSKHFKQRWGGQGQDTKSISADGDNPDTDGVEDVEDVDTVDTVDNGDNGDNGDNVNDVNEVDEKDESKTPPETQ
ncbi:potassium channel subfamily K member 16 [Antennarius striatus]|uniref:potassium channel subfamily K member 16 n=1 Tax=Antennarius striatus TaxID=241820 RepID=UPI0035AF775F